MKTAWSLASLAVTLLSLMPAAALEVGDSPALRQAGSIETSGGATVYDNNAARGGVSSLPGDTRLREISDPCADGGCGLRRGGPPPSDLRREPKSPLVRQKEEEAKAKKSAGKFNWMGLVMIGLGAAGGALAGFLIGGPLGALIGGILGGALGWLAPKVF